MGSELRRKPLGFREYQVEPDITGIVGFLSENGFVARTGDESNCLFVSTNIASFSVDLRIDLPDDFPYVLPKYHLVNRRQYGHLAHVGWSDNPGEEKAEICFGASVAFHINYEDPHEIVLEGLKRTIKTLSDSLLDRDKNEAELLGEFLGFWNYGINSSSKRLLCLAEPKDPIQPLIVKAPLRNSKSRLSPIEKRWIALDQRSFTNRAHFYRKEFYDKQRNLNGKGVLLDLPNIMVPPGPGESIECWWKTLLEIQPPEFLIRIKKHARRERSKEVFIVCRASYNSQSIWFCIHAKAYEKKQMPLSTDYLEDWEMSKVMLDAVNKESLLPRAGTNAQLSDARVCLVGCGSVGGHIADMLASSGLGFLTLVDYDTLETENLHRHILPANALGWEKTSAQKHILSSKYPFIEIKECIGRIVDIQDEEFLLGFDLVVLATGDFTQERMFNDYLRQSELKVPVVCTWVEAYGVGGHAVGILPNDSGCLSCVYVNNETLERSLTPNIDFINPEQEIVSSHAGCGSAFISYSNIDATQTASIASKLSLQVLTGDISESCSVSWKGGKALAESHDVELSHRYYRLSDPMSPKRIKNPDCHACSK